MKDAFATAAAQSVGMPSPAQMKKILTEFEKAMTASASAGGNSEVVTASKQISAAAAKAAAAADPTETAVSQGLQDAGAKLSTACKAAGVNIEF